MSAGRWAAASALALSGLGMGAWGTHLELDREADLEPAAGADLPVSVATPVMSARRVPALLVRPQASRRLNTAMAPLMAKAPAQRCVVVADGRSRVFADNPALPLPAASNQKLVTAFGAIERLGADATLATYVGAGAAPSDGVVAGDLWFIGGGDPLIDTEPYEATLKHGKPPRTPLEAIADRIVAAGVRTITGGVRGDESRYDRERVVASWPSRYIDQAQVGPLSALSVNDGRTYPAIAGAPAAPAKPAADPAAYAAQALHELLVARGVTIAAPPGSGSAPADLTHVVDVPSLAMSQIVAEMLTFSGSRCDPRVARNREPADRRSGVGRRVGPRSREPRDLRPARCNSRRRRHRRPDLDGACRRERRRGHARGSLPRESRSGQGSRQDRDPAQRLGLVGMGAVRQGPRSFVLDRVQHG